MRDHTIEMQSRLPGCKVAPSCCRASVVWCMSGVVIRRKIVIYKGSVKSTWLCPSNLQALYKIFDY
jgi:hypothetical protein